MEKKRGTLEGKLDDNDDTIRSFGFLDSSGEQLSEPEIDAQSLGTDEEPLRNPDTEVCLSHRKKIIRLW